MLPLKAFAAAGILAFGSTMASAADRPVVVELFTSQGCSSCPPANAYLNELVAREPASKVLALAFHVTYWDYLGWKDPFSLQLATDRQARYGRRFGDGSYTPEIVVDGSSPHVGSDRDDVGRAIARAKSESTTVAEVKVVERSGRISIDIGLGHGVAKVILMGFDSEHVTPVARGENRGRTMTETNVVRSFRSIANWNGAAIHLEEDRPAGERFAVLLEGEDGRIVGASASSETASPKR
ncbi:DUF1223 domain-containing protein [Bradyrhizobium sp. 200]|uniref:DUF1223 domain-containing protein n=1 Tax=Bradyrhizobium sp. 200 TaxID=2782665 RepID=UPI001FFEA4F7|nr:DUF1223 domain-containing protein [Bradyrhizobium sp. 200]UPJ53383.1 DUF1223 domain-containing protein [Bradyrhizobium sp. 200]